MKNKIKQIIVVGNDERLIFQVDTDDLNIINQIKEKVADFFKGKDKALIIGGDIKIIKIKEEEKKE